jgi:hypothetical protein
MCHSDKNCHDSDNKRHLPIVAGDANLTDFTSFPATLGNNRQKKYHFEMA